MLWLAARMAGRDLCSDILNHTGVKLTLICDDFNKQVEVYLIKSTPQGTGSLTHAAMWREAQNSVYLHHAVFLDRCRMLTWELFQPSWCTGKQYGYRVSGTCKTPTRHTPVQDLGVQLHRRGKPVTYSLVLLEAVL